MSSTLNKWLLLVLMILPLSCAAQQNILTSISSAKRSDGKGYVIRFHLKKTIKSFELSQPSPTLVQLALHGKDIDTTSVSVSDQDSAFQHLTFYRLKDGIGVDIQLKVDTFYRASAYPDGASKDILLALSHTTEKKLRQHTDKMKSFAWSNNKKVRVLETKDKVTYVSPADSSYLRIKNKIKFDTVVLDPGHGGKDVGAIGYHHTYEKDVALAIAKKVGGYINKYLPDVKVVYTRKDDHLVGAKKDPNISIMQSLVERGQIANRAQGDLFVSIHCNSARSRQAHGTETYFLGLERSKTALEVMKRENNIVGPVADDAGKKPSQEDLIIYELANSGYIATSERLAGMIQSQFKNRAGRKSRGVKQARFVVLYHASMPAILVETGFITNPSEQKFLTSDYGQSIIASAIFRAIRDYKVKFDKSQHFNADK